MIAATLPPSLLCARGKGADFRSWQILLQKSKIERPKNLAKVDLWTSLLLRRFATPLPRSAIDFGRNDMVPLTSTRAKRISGSKNFRSPSQKDFCNMG